MVTADGSRWMLLLVLAPVTEELVFRAGLLEGLLRRGWQTGTAVALSALVFAAAHLVTRTPGWALAIVLPGVLLGALYVRTRRVGPCIALHAAMNGVWLAVVAGVGTQPGVGP